MFSTPLISCSIGVATVSATTSADGAGILAGHADGRRRDLRILGDRQVDSTTARRAIVKMIDSTAAKIGRSMKKCDIRMGCLNPPWLAANRAASAVPAAPAA